ncbi:hypothetical protein M1N05_00115 [Dehalococcoidales bacterium]|nr:hypothetical protein [Dehalococcoidales bacterium]
MNYIETDNTRKVINKLRRYTDKPIEVKDLAELASQGAAYAINYLGSAKEYFKQDRGVSQSY